MNQSAVSEVQVYVLFEGKCSLVGVKQSKINQHVECNEVPQPQEPPDLWILHGHFLI